jgi:hypothetical protein
MKMVFATDDLKDECNNQETLVKLYGSHRAKLVRQRLDELFNADVLADMRTMPHVTFLDSRAPALALDVGYPYRLAFKPTRPPEENGEWDWKKVDSLCILGLIKLR